MGGLIDPLILARPRNPSPRGLLPLFFAAEIGEHTRNQKVMYEIRICSWHNNYIKAE